jgi:hypothetical protein
LVGQTSSHPPAVIPKLRPVYRLLPCYRLWANVIIKCI